MWERYRPAVFLLCGIGLLIFVGYYIRHALLLLWVAALLAIMVSPAVDWIGRLRFWKWSPGRGASVLLLAAAVLIVVGVFAIFAVPPLLQNAHQLEQNWPARVERIHAWAQQHIPFLASKLTPAKIDDMVRRFASTAITPVDAGKALIAVLTALLVAAYFIIDREASLEWLVALFPRAQQRRLRETLVQGGHRAQRWISGQALLMLIHGTSATIAFGILHVRYFYLLGVFAGFINIIPVLGPVITLVVAGVVAAIDSPGKVIGVVIFYLIYHNAENAFLNPRIMEAKVKIPAVTVVVALVVGEALAGLVGMLIAVPTAVLVSVLLNEYVASGPAAVQARRETREEDAAA